MAKEIRNQFMVLNVDACVSVRGCLMALKMEEKDSPDDMFLDG